jgi:metal-responsive CopG/Arc/MetJ family transcriptional regulator
MKKHIILGVHICDRLKRAVDVQTLLSQYGKHVKTRVGLHEPEGPTEPNGLLLLEMWGDEKRCYELADKLNAIEGVEVQKMVFEH